MKLVFGVLGILLLSGCDLLSIENNKKSSSSSSTSESWTYEENDFLKIRLEIPTDISVEESDSTLFFNKGKHQANLIFYCTNFSTLEEHFNDLNVKNNLKSVDQTFFSINGFDAVTRKRDLNSEISHTIYIDGCLYSFSTSSPNLYDDLERIVNSFEYLGEK